MKTIVLEHPHQLIQKQCPEKVIALGFFDGVHRGHQKVIETAKNIADEMGVQSAVMTFHPHPSVVLRQSKEHVKYITPPREKEKAIAELGVDILYIVKFSRDFAALLPQQFVDQYIIGLNAIHVVAGFDYSYGRLGKGTMETISFHSRGKFSSTTVNKVEEAEEKISSTLIRRCLKDGAVAAVAHYLGREYATSGIVIHGEKRGRTIGFPTANIAIDDDYITPASGVYAVSVTIAGKLYNGICNAGYKPTFHHPDASRLSIEVHLFEFNEEIYGERLTMKWHKRLRSEQKFSSAAALISQIEQDKRDAQQYFSSHSVRSANECS